MSRLINLYMRALNRRPLTTQALTAGILMSAGDVTSQLYIEKKTFKEFSVKRSAKLFIFGTFGFGPALRKWYGFLDVFVKQSPAVAAGIKIAMDQLIFAPIFLGVFLGTMTLWATYSPEAAVSKVKRDFKDVLITNYKVWPAAQAVNFYLIPLQHRVLYVSCIAYFWNIYLAYKASN